MKKWLPIVLLLACGETGQERLRIPVFAQGAERDFIDVGEARFTLQRADVGFGPLYLCATQGADAHLCEAALGELLDTVSIDGLSSAASPVGNLEATTGSVRSALYDYGISWLLTEQKARPSAGAPDGHSLVLEGDVSVGEQTLHFLANVDITPLTAGDAALNALATSRELRAGDRLTLRVDPYRWLSRVQVDKLLALDDDGDGQVTLPRDSQAYSAIVLGMTNAAPVALSWDRP